MSYKKYGNFQDNFKNYFNRLPTDEETKQSMDYFHNTYNKSFDNKKNNYGYYLKTDEEKQKEFEILKTDLYRFISDTTHNFRMIETSLKNIEEKCSQNEQVKIIFKNWSERENTIDNMKLRLENLEKK